MGEFNTQFKFENELRIVAMEEVDHERVAVIAQNDAPLPTSLTWQVTQARAEQLHVGQIVKIGLAIEGE